MAPGPLTSVTTTVIAVVGLLGGAGGPFVWNRLHMPSLGDQPVATLAEKGPVEDNTSEIEAPADESVKTDSSIFSVFSGGKDVQSVEQSETFSLFNFAELRKDKLAQLLEKWGLATYTDPVWSALDGWGLVRPTWTEKLSTQLEAFGVANKIDTNNTPGILMLALVADLSLAALFVLWRLFKCCSCCCRSRKPEKMIVECEDASETPAVPLDSGKKQALKDDRREFLHCPTPSRAVKPTLSPPCAPVTSPDKTELEDTTNSLISQPCEPVACPNPLDEPIPDGAPVISADEMELEDAMSSLISQPCEPVACPDPLDEPTPEAACQKQLEVPEVPENTWAESARAAHEKAMQQDSVSDSAEADEPALNHSAVEFVPGQSAHIIFQ